MQNSPSTLKYMFSGYLLHFIDYINDVDRTCLGYWWSSYESETFKVFTLALFMQTEACDKY